jgi:hypothetical protein
MATSKAPHHPHHQPLEAEARCAGCGRTFWAGPGVELPDCVWCANFGLFTGRLRAAALSPQQLAG